MSPGTFGVHALACHLRQQPEGWTPNAAQPFHGVSSDPVDPVILSKLYRQSCRQIGFGRAVSRILSAPESGGENDLSMRPEPETGPRDPGERQNHASLGAGRSAVSYLALRLMGFSVPP